MPPTRPTLQRLLISLVAVAILLVPGAAGAQEEPLPPLPVAPGMPAPIPASSTASGAKVAKGLVLETVTTATQDPTAITVAPDGRVIFAERQGAIKVVTADGETVEAARILTNATGCLGCPDQTLEEGGVHGVEVAADFAKTGRIYVYYSVPFSVGTTFGPNEAVFRLSSFVLTEDNTLDMGSEKVLLRNPAGTLACCHYGGDIDVLGDGTVTLTVGDDTSPRMPDGMAPRDQRPGFEEYNAERTAQNPADRRGKILRFMPDGSVPDGTQRGIVANPHVDDPDFDPYVYAMGFRSNYRAATDSVTGSIFVGNVGPDAAVDDPNRGPKGYDELEVVPAGGGTNHGWPRCIGNNIPYRDFDYVTQTAGAPLSCKGFEPAAMWYPYGPSEQFPELGDDGGRTAAPGVVYRYDGKGEYRLPDKYQGKLLFMEWSRNKIWTLPVVDRVKANGKPVKRYGQVRPGRIKLIAEELYHPIDAAVGPDGAVYLAEYGTTFYMNGSSRISRLVPAGASKVAAEEAATDGASSAGLPTSLPLSVGAGALVLLAARRRRNAVV